MKRYNYLKFICTILIFVCTFESSFGSICSRTVKNSFFSRPIRLQLSDPAPALPYSGYNWLQKIEYVNLVIDANSEVGEIAKYLGTNQDPSLIENKIRRQMNIATAAETQIPLVSLLPQFAREKTNTFPQKGSSLNCFYSVLQWHGIKTREDLISSNEMDGKNGLLANHFKKVSKGQPLKGEDITETREASFKFGDVIVLRETSRSDYLLHAIIFIAPNLIWHKPGPDTDMGWMFQTWDQMLNITSNKKIFEAGGIKIELYRKTVLP